MAELGKKIVLEPPRQSAGPAPLRVHGSVRRTSSIDVSWPDGPEGNQRFVGRARDVVTPKAGGLPITRREDSFVASIQRDRVIASIEATPPRAELAQLVGKRGGGHLREALQHVMAEDWREATPLYLILDDISGVSLIGAFAWMQWDPEWMASMRARMANGQFDKLLAEREGVCIGWAPGSSAFDADVRKTGATPVPDLRNPEDPEGWHAFTVQEKVGMRRARRIDVTCDNEIVIDTAFQDSATSPKGGRVAVHEYTIRMTADPQSLKVLSIKAEPRILPFGECPSATANLTKLIGTPLGDLRNKVLSELRGTAGCTHLNDAMRALADVPALLKFLP